MERIKKFEEYTYEDFTINDMEMVQELWEDGLTDIKQIAIEMDLSEATIEQIVYTLKKRGDI